MVRTFLILIILCVCILCKVNRFGESKFQQELFLNSLYVCGEGVGGVL